MGWRLQIVGSEPDQKTDFEASTHGAFSWFGGDKSSVLNPTKKTDFEFFWGRGGGVPGRGRQRRELGGGVGEGGGREVEGSGLTMGMWEEKKH